jgi:hypothetical protein
MPPNAQDVLVIKKYLDAPYNEDGYDDDKSFWIDPVIQIDSYWSDKSWYSGGKVTHWMPLPEMPNDSI